MGVCQTCRYVEREQLTKQGQDNTATNSIQNGLPQMSTPGASIWSTNDQSQPPQGFQSPESIGCGRVSATATTTVTWSGASSQLTAPIFCDMSSSMSQLHGSPPSLLPPGAPYEPPQHRSVPPSSST